jgi:hypothetical protein
MTVLAALVKMAATSGVGVGGSFGVQAARVSRMSNRWSGDDFMLTSLTALCYKLLFIL